MANIIIDIIGYVGAALILIAYFLLTHKKLTQESKIYHSLNLFGGLGIIINASFFSSYPSVALNIIWSVIALYGIFEGLGIFKRKKKGNMPRKQVRVR